MENPYLNLPDSAYWRRSVAAVPGGSVDPVTAVPFEISRDDRVATAGSCFAQHIARELKTSGFDLMVEEQTPEDPQDLPAWSAFSAAFGNIYTARQLVQLFERAYGLFHPRDTAWRRADGRYVDPFRPLISKAGYDSADEVKAARLRHFEAVRTVFDTCDVLIFTLGLTESWVAQSDGAVFPIAPGVDADPGSENYEFHNASIDEVVQDMGRFLGFLSEVNPAARVILTVSPVPLIATYEARHVLVSTVASKSILRTAADMVSASNAQIAYFPSYEIITGPQARGAYFAEDLRSVTPQGVAHVMDVFGRRYLSQSNKPARAPLARKLFTREEMAASGEKLAQLSKVICDEEILDPGTS